MALKFIVDGQEVKSQTPVQSGKTGKLKFVVSESTSAEMPSASLITPEIETAQQNFLQKRLSADTLPTDLSKIAPASSVILSPEEKANQAHWDKHPLLNKLAHNPVSNALNWMGKKTDVMSEGLGSVFAQTTPSEAITTGNPEEDKILRTIGNMESYFVPGGAGSKGGVIRDTTNAITSKIFPVAEGIANKAGKKVVTGAIESLPYTAQQIMTQKDITPKEAVKAVADNALLGSGTELGLAGMGALIKKLKPTIPKKAIDGAKSTAETLVDGEQQLQSQNSPPIKTIGNTNVIPANKVQASGMQKVKLNDGKIGTITSTQDFVGKTNGKGYRVLDVTLDDGTTVTVNSKYTKPVQPLNETGNTNIRSEEIQAQNGAQDVKKIVGEEPVIEAGKKERGFSANTRTDVNNPDSLRDSYSENPLTYEQLGNPTTLAKAQAIFDQGYESARTQVSALAGSMKPEAVPLAKMLSRQATEAGNIQGAREILSDVAEKLTQAGQFSQAARLLREADPETFLMTIGKQLKKLNQEGAEQYGKKWTNFDLTPEELDMVSKIERGNQASYESAFEQIQKRIANEMPASAMEKVNAWRHMSMLLNPKTHIRNVTGNAIMMGMRKVAQRVSGIAQKALKAEDRTQAVFINREYKQAANDYFEANKKDLLSGPNKYNENLTLNMPDKRVFRNNALEATRKFNYKLLELGDTPFFKNAYVDRLASYAKAKGIKDFSKLDQAAFDTALKEAEQATYKDASDIANTLNRWKHPKKDANILKKGGAVIAEAALPFTKTPINIIKRGLQYSPVGIIDGIQMWKSAGAAAKGIDEMAKGLTGTAIMGLGALLASKGILTGKAEQDIDLKMYNANTGNSPFSILGKYSYDWAQPFAVPLTIGVEIYNAVKDNPDEAKKLDALIQNGSTEKWKDIAIKFSDGIINSLNASGDTVFNMSIMKGIRQLLGSGTKGFMEGVAQLPQNYAMQYIPTVLSQAAGQIDPTVRQTYYKNSPVDSAKATALSKIPFASKSLQPKQTAWGQDVKRPENPITRLFSQFLSPGIISVPQDIDPAVDTELRRLNKAGETIQFPRIATERFTWKGQQFNLTPEEYTRFQKTLGQNTLAAYAEEIQKPEYQALNDQDKAKELSAIISDAQDLARFQLIQSKGLANSPEIMSVPETIDDPYTKGIKKKLTFEQQNELADSISKYKKLYALQKGLTLEKINKAASEAARLEMQLKLFSNPNK